MNTKDALEQLKKTKQSLGSSMERVNAVITLIEQEEERVKNKQLELGLEFTTQAFMKEK